MRTLGLGTCVIVALAATALLDRESGVGNWRALRQDLAVSAARVAVLARENEAMREEIAVLEAEPSAIDRAIREELDLALPGEVVVRFASASDAGLADAEALRAQDRRGFLHRSSDDPEWRARPAPDHGTAAGRGAW